MQTTKILLSGVILATLSACGGGGSDSTPTADPQQPAAQNQPATTTQNQPAAETPTQPAPQPATVKYPLSAAEQSAFEASKVDVLDGEYNAELLTVSGKKIIESTDGSTRHRDFRSLPTGFVTLPGEYVEADQKSSVSLRSYQGFRSGVAIGYYDTNHKVSSYDIYGLTPPATQLPAAGKASYSGTAFDHNERGTLPDNVDFSAKTGEGKIDGLSRYGSINLHKGDFEGDNEDKALIAADASDAQGQSLRYYAWLAGNGAEEVVGFVKNDGSAEVGFHGERGEITK